MATASTTTPRRSQSGLYVAAQMQAAWGAEGPPSLPGYEPYVSPPPSPPGSMAPAGAHARVVPAVEVAAAAAAATPQGAGASPPPPSAPVTPGRQQTEDKALTRLLRGMVGVPREIVARSMAHRGRPVREGTVFRVCRTGQKRRYMWLFGDCLVVAASITLAREEESKPSFRGLVTCPHAFPVQVTGRFSERAGKFGIRIVAPEKTFTVVVDSAKDRDAWLAAFRSLSVDEFHKERKASNCTACGQSFGLLKRRKYCMQCGRAVCGACSDWRAVIPDIDPFQLQRVCRACFTNVAVSGGLPDGNRQEEDILRAFRSTDTGQMRSALSSGGSSGPRSSRASFRLFSGSTGLVSTGALPPMLPPQRLSVTPNSTPPRSAAPGALCKSMSDELPRSRQPQTPPAPFRVSAIMMSAAGDSSGSSSPEELTGFSGMGTPASAAAAAAAAGVQDRMLVWPTSLRFGLGSRQAQVDKRLEDTLTLANNTRQKMYFQVLLPPADMTAHRCRLAVDPTQGSLHAGRMQQVHVSLTIFCTTTVNVPLTVLAWPASSTSPGLVERVGSVVEICIESQLSTRLDANEVIMIHPPIGEGTFGSVYLGKFRGLDVAVKMLKPTAYSDVGDEEAASVDFQAEVHYLSQVRHPCIVNYIGSVDSPARRLIVTEYCRYGNLSKAMRHYCFSDMLKLRCLLDCASAMDFLHRSNILHRDIKPDNLLVVSLESAAPVVCKVSDFGTMRDVDPAERQRAASNAVGSPLYMAPEIFSMAVYEKPCDVFSFGVVLYEIMTELRPDEDSLCQRPWDYTRLITEGWRPKIPAIIPESVKLLIMDCWAADQNSRPTFSDICQRLSPLCNRF